jgi:hypothetical protein
MATAPKSPKAAAKKTPKKAPGARSNARPTTTTGKDTPTKGPGVIATLLDDLRKATKDKPLTKEALLERLTKKFPDREPDSMKKTINCQVPGRIAKEQGVKVHRNEEGGFWIA